MNIVGNAQNWLFGTMDDQDRRDIDAHLHTLDVNNHNIIETINQQVDINKHFNDTFRQLKDIANRDRNIFSDKINRISSSTLMNNMYYDQLFKVQILQHRIENLQDNVASARYGMLHPNILTDEEIAKYDVNFSKLQYIKVGVAKSNKNLLLFAIKIPKEFVTVQLKRLLPIPNKQNKEIDYPSETVFTLNENVYKYEKLKTLNELSLSKHCVYRQTCKLIKK